MRLSYKVVMLLSAISIVVDGCVSQGERALPGCVPRPESPLQGHLLLSVGTDEQIIDLERCEATKKALSGFGRWSPDGQRLAVSIWEGGSSPYTNIAVFDLNTGSMVPIAHKRFQAETPDWSPDSIWLAFIEGDERLGPDKINLLAVKTDGSDLHTVISCGEQGCRNARWSNDGQRIAFGSSQGLEVVSADGRTREVVYKSKARGVFNLDWSPTSSQIALLESSPFPLPVVTLVDLFDKSAREIRLPVIPREVVWSPTGEQLAIRGSTPDWEEDRLVIIDQQGNELMNIKLDLNAAGLDWGP